MSSGIFQRVWMHFLLRYRECSGGMKSETTFVGASQVWSGRICIRNLFIFCNSFDSLYGEEEGGPPGGLTDLWKQCAERDE